MIDLEPILVHDGELEDVDVAALHSRAGILEFSVISRTVLPPADRNTGAFTQEIDQCPFHHARFDIRMRENVQG